DRLMPANDWRELLSLQLTDLKRYDLFQGHFSCGLLDLLPADVTPITFLREPVARTISHLKHLRRDPSFSPMAYEVAAGRGLDELCATSASSSCAATCRRRCCAITFPVKPFSPACAPTRGPGISPIPMRLPRRPTWPRRKRPWRASALSV